MKVAYIFWFELFVSASNDHFLKSRLRREEGGGRMVKWNRKRREKGKGGREREREEWEGGIERERTRGERRKNDKTRREREVHSTLLSFLTILLVRYCKSFSRSSSLMISRSLTGSTSPSTCVTLSSSNAPEKLPKYLKMKLFLHGTWCCPQAVSVETMVN